MGAGKGKGERGKGKGEGWIKEMRRWTIKWWEGEWELMGRMNNGDGKMKDTLMWGWMVNKWEGE